MSQTVTLYKCDKCGNIITNPKSGLVVQGNIYVADPVNVGGLVGNNFPASGGTLGDPKFAEHMVKKSVYCVPCFLNTVLPDTKLTTTR